MVKNYKTGTIKICSFNTSSIIKNLSRHSTLPQSIRSKNLNNSTENTVFAHKTVIKRGGNMQHHGGSEEQPEYKMNLKETKDDMSWIQIWTEKHKKLELVGHRCPPNDPHTP